ncbi:MAG: NOB1 family endonuclease [Thermoplasmata archaeon]
MIKSTGPERKVIVLDTSAFIARNFNFTDPDTVVPASVMGEIRKGKLKRSLDYADEMLNVRTPGKPYRESVMDYARKTGDLNVLSDTDIDVIALGLEMGGTVMTDDFAIQNVCRVMGISVIPATNLFIGKTIRWTYRCTGCRKYFKSYREKCDVCGHEVRRISSGKGQKDKI